MMTIKNIYLMGLIAGLLVCSAAYAQHTYHSWVKVSEQNGYDGMVVCQWKCNIYGDEHYATTSGRGQCPPKW